MVDELDRWMHDMDVYAWWMNLRWMNFWAYISLHLYIGVA
jgi:hypothetical protein